MIFKKTNFKARKVTVSIIVLGISIVSYLGFTKSNTHIDFYCRFDDLISEYAYEIPVPVKLYVDNEVILDTVFTEMCILTGFTICETTKGFHSVKVSVYDDPPIDLGKSFFFLNLHYYSITIYHDKRVEGTNYLKWQPYE